MTRFITLVLIVLLALPAAAQDVTPEMMLPLPAEVVIDVAGILPEGVEYHPTRSGFLFGSLSKGTIHHIDVDGTISVFAEADGLIATVGIHVDAPNNRLLVANSNGITRDLASLFAFDLETGELLYSADMSDLYSDSETAHFANDVTADADGNAYVTDSFAPVIYRITPEGDASIFAQNDGFAVEGFGLNGIDYHPDGYLLAAVGASGAIYKVPLDDPSDITQVTLPYPIGIDGMALDADNNLVAVGRPQDGEGNRQVIAVISSADEWESAEIALAAETTGAATTLALADGAAYYINAYLSNPAQTEYQIVRVDYADTMME
ncbi:MAG: SMP-30/gluconolactonase/LRE family protein [Chloroflexota bacterium]|nr:SMP-30/gluconolactonase/LRE family protein [Chloroflexota bacterium]